MEERRRLEISVMAHFIKNQNDYIKRISTISKGLFPSEDIRPIFIAFNELILTDSEPDDVLILTLLHRKKWDIKSVKEALTEIMNTTVIKANLDTNIKLLREYYSDRKHAEMAERMRKADPEEMQAIAEEYSFLRAVNAKAQSYDLVQTIEEINAEEKEILENGGNRSKILETGYKWIDKKCPLQAGEVTVIPAFSGCGKTTLAMNIIWNVLRQGKTILFFSMEMSREVVLDKMLQQQQGVDAEAFRETPAIERITRREALRAEIKNHGGKLEIIDNIDIIEDAEIYAREVNKKFKIDLVVIDYIQLMSSEKKKTSRAGELAIITRKLKMLSKKLECPMVELAQMTNEAAKRKKMPTMNDIKDGQSIQADASSIMVIYRNSYWEEKSTDPEAYINIVKNRISGKTGRLPSFWYDKKYDFYRESKEEVERNNGA